MWKPIYIQKKKVKNWDIYWKLVMEVKKDQQSKRFKKWYEKNKTKHRQYMRDYYGKYKVGGNRIRKSAMPDPVDNVLNIVEGRTTLRFD